MHMALFDPALEKVNGTACQSLLFFSVQILRHIIAWVHVNYFFIISLFQQIQNAVFGFRFGFGYLRRLETSARVIKMVHTCHDVNHYEASEVRLSHSRRSSSGWCRR